MTTQTLPDPTDVGSERRLRRELLAPDLDAARHSPASQWRWVTVPDRYETVRERRERYLADEREMDMAGVAAATGLAYATVLERFYDACTWRGMLAPYRVDPDKYAAALRALELADGDEARRDAAMLVRTMDDNRATYLRATLSLIDAMPANVGRHGQSPTFKVCEILMWAAKRRTLNQWYEPSDKDGRGSRPGSKKGRCRPGSEKGL